MPIYEYQCRKCGGRLERLQGIHDPALSKCPSCGGRVDKLMSAGGFILKGSGFYANDYPSKSNGNGSGPAKKKREAAPCAAAGADASPACEGCPKAK